MAERKAHAKWEGSIREGSGSMALGSGAYEGPYSFKSRFEEGTGTNPEELVGAAHAGCFSMALSLILTEQGHAPESIETTARVHLRAGEGGATIPRIDLDTQGRVPGIDEDGFRKAAELAKANCPVSKALAGVGEITLNARLAS